MKKTGVLWGVLENVLQFVYKNRPCKQKMRLLAHIKEEWALDTHPIELLIFILSQGQKEGFSHQLHSESEAVREGIALGDAVHLVHAFLELFERFLLLIRERAIQFLTVPGDQLQQLLQPLVATGALLKGGDVAVP